MADDPAPPALVLRTDRLRAARGVVVARQVALSASPGDVVAVEGVNGSGKSTLLAATAGLLPTSGGTRRPASVGYAPERADVLPRLAVRRWLTGLARTAGLSRAEAAGQTDELLTRLGLAAYQDRPLRALSRGNVQRALIAQALLGSPGLLVLDEPSGGLDADGVSRLAAEIQRAASGASVVLVARHPTAPLPLPAGPTWRIGDGAVRTEDRAAASVPVIEVATGDGTVRQVTEAELPAVLRTALDAGLAIRRVQPVLAAAPAAALVPGHPAPGSAATPRAGALGRITHGAAHRARLLTASQWFAAPALLFLAVLGIIYAGNAGPSLMAPAFTAVVLVPVMTWMTVLAHLVDGRLVARAFAAHLGGRGRAHLAACLATAPFAAAASVAAAVLPFLTQPFPQHSGWPLVQAVMLFFLKVVTLHLAAAVFGVGVGALLVPPIVDRAGWRICLATALFLALLLVPASPMHPLLLLTTHAATQSSLATATGVLAGTGVALIGLTTFLAARLP
jgi:ABC-2 type transport system ATP-binding protein